MPWGPRVTETSVNSAEGDKLYWSFQYSGASGNLTAFMPVFKDFSDSAEYDYVNSTTKFVAPAVPVNQQTAGKATVGNDFNAGATLAAAFTPLALGIYSPTNPNDRPSTGDIIRVMRSGGVTPIQISAGQTAAIGDIIYAKQGQPLAFTAAGIGNIAPSTGVVPIGRVTAFGNQISVGAAPTQTLMTGSSYNGFLINGWVGPFTG